MWCCCLEFPASKRITMSAGLHSGFKPSLNYVARLKQNRKKERKKENNVANSQFIQNLLKNFSHGNSTVLQQV